MPPRSTLAGDDKPPVRSLISALGAVWSTSIVGD
jgi:hypothetical protein